MNKQNSSPVYELKMQYKSLHQRIAENLEWTIEQVESFSLLTLRDIMKARSPKLAHEITLVIEPGKNRGAYLAWNGREGTTVVPTSLTNAYHTTATCIEQQEESESDVDSQFIDDDEDEDEEEIEIEYDKSGYPVEASKNQNGFQSILNKKMSNCSGRYYLGWASWDD